MSHFYGTIDPNNSRKEATKCGHKATGLTTYAAGWGGAVRVEVFNSEGVDKYRVYLQPWKGSGGSEKLIAEGTLDAQFEASTLKEAY